MSSGHVDKGMSSGHFDKGSSRGKLMHENTRSAILVADTHRGPTSMKKSTELPRVAEAISKKARNSKDTSSKQTVERSTREKNLGHRPPDDIEMIAQECEIGSFPIFKESLWTARGIINVSVQDIVLAIDLGSSCSGTCWQSWAGTENARTKNGQNGLKLFRTTSLNLELPFPFLTNTHVNMSIHDAAQELKQTNKIGLIIVDSSQKNIVVEALKTAGARNVGVLFLGESDETPVLPYVYFGHTQSNSIINDADRLLERCAFGVLKQVYLEMNSELKTEKEKQCLQDIFDMIRASFKRSGVPIEEWPSIPEEIVDNSTDIDTALEDIFKLPTVIGCKKARGILQIYIDSSADSSVEDHIRSMLAKHEIDKIHFSRRITKQLCCPGDSLFGGQGTLGGFVLKHKSQTVSVRDQELEPVAVPAASLDTLVALVSRHVVHTKQTLLVDGMQQPIGNITQINADEEIDIWPVDVDDACRAMCDTSFRTEECVRMRVTKLRRTENIRELRGAPVYIWGSKSKPGLGTLYGPDFRDRNGLNVIVRDRTNEAPFAQEGDSGAMVCYYDARNGGMLYATAMVVKIMRERDGSNQEYIAQIVDDTLQILAMRNGCEYEFVG
ncbi:hypothetical protein DPMN_095286 [Dreissena polymorpha]|uniref:Uncharacterized protein n=1 Tax=Dreissena polymorpha TaxID=45954 RepID=A0A9D4L7P2_DREPO|nr:hypothetical protein DPMN_095286 [Dreissena polymorpha]